MVPCRDRFRSQVVIVTGGSAGIGKEIALAFVREGAHVIVWGTHQGRVEEAKRECSDAKIFSEQECEGVVVNVACQEAVERAAESVLHKWGQIDVLVNNAGITRDGLLMKMSKSDWDEVLQTNLNSVYHTCKAVIRSMMKAKKGKIINISSVVGLTGNAGQVNYAASKAGMIGFTKSLALEVARRGIQANCIAPGFIETAMTGALTEQQKEAILSKVPLGRMGRVSDISGVVLFLASPCADYMTGQVLVVDGGMVM